MSHLRSYVACALLAGTAFGCSKKSEPAPTAAAETAKTPPEHTAPKPRLDPEAIRGKGARTTLAPITLDEVAKFMPAPAGARELKALAKAAVGERVVATYCFDHGEIAELMPVLEKTYRDAGWDPLTVKLNPKQADRAFVIGQKAPYTLSGSLQRGVWTECDQTKGQTYLMIGAHHLAGKINLDPSVRLRPVGAPGTTGATTGGAGAMPAEPAAKPTEPPAP